MESILKLLQPWLGDVETKLAKAMDEEDKEFGTKNIAYLIRRVKSMNAKGEVVFVCQMSKIDIEGYTAVQEDPSQEYALKALFVKDKKGKNISQGIDGIFSSVTGDKE